MVSSENTKRIQHDVLISIVKLLVDLIVIICVYVFWCNHFGFVSYTKTYGSQYIQFYLVYAYITVIGFILNVIKLKYEHLNKLFQKQVTVSNISTNKTFFTLTNIERNIYFLKDVVDNFNAVFGWPIALIISNTNLYILNNLDYIYRVSVRPDEHLGLRIVADVLLIFLVFVWCIFNICFVGY